MTQRENNTIGFIDDPIFDQHETGSHPENSSRLVAIRRAIERSDISDVLTPLRYDAAEPDEIALAHERRHVDRIARIADRGGAWIDGDTVVTPRSYEVAARAVGAATRIVASVIAGEHRASAAIVRPPGHHASDDQAMGFCLFNNVAVAAAVARERFGVERSLIIDFDVHHGNGTQDIFYRDPSVFYFSVHQWPLFPGTGRVDEIGEGPGRGMTANVPLPAGCGNDEYRLVFDQVLFPLARRYQPQLILISAGYDAYFADPLANQRITIEGYAHLVAAIRALADELCPGRLALVLEGGYNPAGLGAAFVATLGELADRPTISEPIAVPGYRGSQKIDDVIRAARSAHGL